MCARSNIRVPSKLFFLVLVTSIILFIALSRKSIQEKAKTDDMGISYLIYLYTLQEVYLSNIRLLITLSFHLTSSLQGVDRTSLQNNPIILL